MSATLTEFNTIQSLENVTAEEVIKLSKKISNLKKLEQELNKMKHGSIAYIHQFTTISKQRIFRTPILSGIKISSTSLDKIDNKIISLFTK